jgi:hypothetical protein
MIFLGIIREVIFKSKFHHIMRKNQLKNKNGKMGFLLCTKSKNLNNYNWVKGNEYSYICDGEDFYVNDETSGERKIPIFHNKIQRFFEI